MSTVISSLLASFLLLLYNLWCTLTEENKMHVLCHYASGKRHELDEDNKVNFRATSKITRVLTFVALIYQRQCGHEDIIYILNTAKIHAEMCY
jgi:hypothetical protein